MVFTKEEEEVLRLLINQIKANMKLEIEREGRDADMRSRMSALNSEVDALHNSLPQLTTDVLSAKKKFVRLFQKWRDMNTMTAAEIMKDKPATDR